MDELTIEEKEAIFSDVLNRMRRYEVALERIVKYEWSGIYGVPATLQGFAARALEQNKTP